MKWLFTNARIFDGTAAPAFDGEVMVEDELVVAVARQRNQLPRQGARVIDAQGRTLMPGLIEPHGHLSFPDISDVKQLEAWSPEELAIASTANATTMLSCGYTACFSAAALRPRIDVAIRDAINKGTIDGPHLWAAGPEITVSGGLGDANHCHRPTEALSSFSWVVDGEDQMRYACRVLAREGVDTFKLNLSGDEFVTAAGPETTVMTEPEVAAAMDVARVLGKRVCVHARGAGSVKQALRHGIRIIHHANFLDSEAIDALTDARDNVFVVPALGVSWNLCTKASPWGITPEKARAAGLAAQVEATLDGVPKLRARGVPVLPGGDYGFAWNPHGTYALELVHFVDRFGFSPQETVVAATSTAARVFGRQHDMGQIRQGYIADLLLVEGDPLHDISCLCVPENLQMVMKAGRLFAGRKAVCEQEYTT